jgi:hypothetical protein
MSDQHRSDAFPGDLDDDALLARLGESLSRVDPPPSWLVDLAKLSYGLGSIDVELAELVADSHVDEPALAVRAASTGTQPRLLAFESGDLAVEIEISFGADDVLSIHGQLVPPASATVEVRQPAHRPVEISADELGRFAAHGIAPGPLSVVCRWGDAAVLASTWVVV